MKRRFGVRGLGLAAVVLLWGTVANAQDDESGGLGDDAARNEEVLDLGGIEEQDAPRAIQNWFVLALQYEVYLLPTANEGCASTSRYTCYYGDGTPRIVGANSPTPGVVFAEPGAVNPSTGQRVGAGDDASGEVAVERLLLGFDRVFLRNFTGGARFGLQLGATSDPPQGVKSFPPVSGELNFGYWFGSQPFTRKGFRYFTRLSVGMAQVQQKVTTSIIDMRRSDFDPNAPAVPANGPNPTVEIWKTAGNFFGSLTLGAQWAIRPYHGPLLELKAIALFPDSAIGIGTQAAYAIGF
ncbi:MAG TPA: hypothetical protein VHO25_14235 [Polyangiaceae bacterium]|nr:hypothetical protein [Polyangiaceae bacterium]